MGLELVTLVILTLVADRKDSDQTLKKKYLDQKLTHLTSQIIKREPWSWEETHVMKVVGSNHSTLSGYFFTYLCCKNCNFCWKVPKINEKEAVDGPFFNKKQVRFSKREKHA